MDGTRFDGLLRHLTHSRSRRGALLGLLGAAIGLIDRIETEARPHKKKPKKKKRGLPPSASCQRSCLGKTCGDDGCGGSCGACQGDKTCLGGTCACPSGEIECDTNVCVPPDAQCCTDGQCPPNPARACIHGRCVTWQGICPSGANTCNGDTGCASDCGCYPSTEGDTRCGKGVPGAECLNCQSTAECVARRPDIPGIFCTASGPNCCPGSCVMPCPS